jgi:hypothetical protein
MVNFTNSNYTFKANNQQQQRIPAAHIVKENPFQQVASSVTIHSQNVKNLGDAIVNARGTDYTLGRMNDTTIRMGSLGIASLASALAYSKFSGVNEFIGFACWFASMGMAPKIINKMVEVKYGLDLDKEYVDSYGRRKKVFDDPGFICWDLIPQDELNRIGDKMGVPQGIINRNEAIQEKITQIVVQSKTWMMVSAGVATPVFASLMADGINQLKNPVMSFLHKQKMNGLAGQIENAIHSGNVDKAKQLFAKAVDGTFGMKEGSAIARMWQTTPKQMVKETGILEGAVQKVGDFFQNAKQVLTGKKAWIPRVSKETAKATESMKIKAITEHLMTNPQQAQLGATTLKSSVSQVDNWSKALLKIMETHPELQDDVLKQFIEFRAGNYKGGFENMIHVLQQAGKTSDPKQIQRLVKGLSDAGAREFLVNGNNQQMILDYLGKTPRNEKLLKEITTLIQSGQKEQATNMISKHLVSKRPIKLVDDAVQETLLHRRWLKRIGGIGLGLLAATALYTFFVMGRANKFNPEIKK